MLSLILLAAAATVNAIPTITTKGSKFFTSDGDQYFLKGIAYQLVPDDPLIDNTQCSLDAALMKDIGANAIRVYHVDPSGNHDDCMRTFADAGIYLWLDLDTFDTQIEQTAPRWNTTQKEAFQDVLDAFIQYDNLGGVFVGNEVLTTGTGSVAAPYVKAAARDLKAYRNSKNYRKVPIGYSAADIASLRPMLQNYLVCGDNADESLDFFALNAYEWCGDATYETSGYEILNDMVKDFPVPIYFSETGCIVPKPRTFDDQAAILGDKMNQYWSGAIIYEWIMEANDYGLISYGAKVDPASNNAPPDGFPRSGTPTPLSPDFPNLSRHWATLNPTGIKESAYSPSLTAPPCPASTAGTWEIDGDVDLPSVGQVYAPTSTSGRSSPSASMHRSFSSSTALDTASVISPSTAFASASVSASANPNDQGNFNAESGNTGAEPSASETQTGGGVAATSGNEVRNMAISLITITMGLFWWM
ncbi:hypothetical protein EJ05DRAFT_514935 [Pseudovirgaria hyperparasitica]|uniref:1,3-beta-glucanosyltransferase n=1 Tax=Pseudovirgaria hyperparasitica TaxID=470096 RepID=A0A6A6VUK1_9PEZI|nr:uncharacterized protein EJ05DRAFT_514935 [Pseudovirgaria hyperparasitica]KAF2753466.1 hypothetical protein EJ05DRAFT_514935 [Pseudovirgaria hyperparasitica]